MPNPNFIFLKERRRKRKEGVGEEQSTYALF
jgi:hypothetical protein